MLIEFTMKTPDVYKDKIHEAVKREARLATGLGQDDLEIFIEAETDRLFKLFSRWFRHQECITLVVDTEAETIRVVPN